MPTLKTSDLTGAALDWAVATAEGHKCQDRFNTTGKAHPDGRAVFLIGVTRAASLMDAHGYEMPFMPSVEWAHGGPIVERMILAGYVLMGEPGKVACMRALGRWDGPTALIAAMRAYVASRLGNRVAVPENLL